LNRGKKNDGVNEKWPGNNPTVARSIFHCVSIFSTYRVLMGGRSFLEHFQGSSTIELAKRQDKAIGNPAA
jgi:hypothetical protein